MKIDFLQNISKRTKVQIARHWIEGKRNGVTFFELIKFVMDRRTSQAIARTIIDNIEETETQLVIYFNDIEHPLYYPKIFKINLLYQVIAETCFLTNWHYYEIEETKVQPEDIVVDCGAAEGLFSLIVAQKCAKVYVVEPLLEFVEALKLTFDKMNNVEILPYALSDDKGTAFLTEFECCSSINPNGLGTKIEVDTLDNLFQNIPISYLKADIEGYELKMLHGAQNIIKKYKPKIAITTYHEKDHAILISSFLKSIDAKYNIKIKGIEKTHGAPVMLHAWI